MGPSLGSLPGQGLVPTALTGRVRCLQLFLGRALARGQRLCAVARLTWQDSEPAAGTRSWEKRPLSPERPRIEGALGRLVPHSSTPGPLGHGLGREPHWRRWSAGPWKGEQAWDTSQGHQRRAGIWGGAQGKNQEPHQWGWPRNLGTLGNFVSCFSVHYFVVLHCDRAGSCKKDTRVCGLFFGGKRVGGAGEAIHSKASLEMGGASKAPGHFPEPWSGPCVCPPTRGSCLVMGMLFPTRL